MQLESKILETIKQKSYLSHHSLFSLRFMHPVQVEIVVRTLGATAVFNIKIDLTHIAGVRVLGTPAILNFRIFLYTYAADICYVSGLTKHITFSYFIDKTVVGVRVFACLGFGAVRGPFIDSNQGNFSSA